MTVRTRFAPSPTGVLQIGNARTALFNWLLARHEGGQMLLRIEDTDVERSKPEFVDAMFAALEWLGLDWDEEPVFQSQRRDAHVEAVERLLADGRAYYCDCTRDEIDARAKERGGKPGYDGHCRERGLTAADGTPERGVVVRFRAPDEGATSFVDAVRGEVSFPNADIEDFVVLRSSGEPMFLVANAVDDADMKVNHILRGEDLLNATPKTLLLRDALGYGTDGIVFGHLPLIVDDRRKKLSKRNGAVPVEEYRSRGYLPQPFTTYLTTLGWGAPDGVEQRPLAEIVDLFTLESVNKAPAMFDQKKLDAFNGDSIRALPVSTFVELSRPWLDDAPWPADRFDQASFDVMAPLVQERVTRLGEVPGMVDFLFLPAPIVEEDSWAKVMAKDPVAARGYLDLALERLGGLDDWTAEAINSAVMDDAESGGEKRRRQAPIRVAITGRSVGPPLWESMQVLGREASLERLRAAVTRLGEVGGDGG